MEHLLYDRDSGQLLSGSFAEYAIPRASVMPHIVGALEEIPCTTNPWTTNVHLIAAAPTGYYLEHMPWGEPLFNEKLELVGGAINIPPHSGLGLSWDEQAIARYLAQ